MRIVSVRLRNFRNLGDVRLEAPGDLNLVAGPNGEGKTNLLEALHFALLGRSFRTRRDEDCIPWSMAGASGPGEETFVEAHRSGRTGEDSTRIVLSPKGKRVFRDGKLLERVGEMWRDGAAVAFTPQDVDLFREGPAGRRRFLDLTLAQNSPAYLDDLTRYQRALRQANAALKSRDSDEKIRARASAFHPELARAGAALVVARREAAERLHALCGEIHGELGGSGALQIDYQSQIGTRGETNPSDLESVLRDALAAAHDDSRRQGSIEVGPHRDDLRARLAGRDLARFGSQGQNRLAALALKLGAARLIRDRTGEPPVLLLDDFGSELDAGRRRATLESLRGRMQVFVTATAPEDLGSEDLFDRVWRVESGRLRVAAASE